MELEYQTRMIAAPGMIDIAEVRLHADTATLEQPAPPSATRAE